MEEFSMRAGYYNALKAMFGKTRLSAVMAALVSSVLFSLLHNAVYGFNPFSFFEIIWLSIIFTAAYQLSGSIWVAIGVHAVKNGLAFISVAAKRGALAPYSLEVALIILAVAALSAVVSYGINVRKEKANVSKIIPIVKNGKAVNAVNIQSALMPIKASTPVSALVSSNNINVQNPILISQPSRAPPENSNNIILAKKNIAVTVMLIVLGSLIFLSWLSTIIMTVFIVLKVGLDLVPGRFVIDSLLLPFGILGTYFVWKNYKDKVISGQTARFRNILRRALFWSLVITLFAAATTIVSAYFNIYLYIVPEQAVELPLLLLSSVMAVLIAPVLEEFIFKGGIYNLFKKFMPSSKGKAVAAIITASIFAVMHLPRLMLLGVSDINVFLVALMLLFALGIVTTIAYEKSGSIHAPIAIHTLYNLFIQGAAVIIMQELGIPVVALFWGTFFVSVLTLYLVLNIRRNAVFAKSPAQKLSAEKTAIVSDKAASPALVNPAIMPSMGQLPFNLPSQQMQSEARAPPENSLWKTSLMVVSHFALIVGATALFAATAHTIFQAFVPSFLVVTGIFLLWKDITAYKENRPAELLYIYAPRGVPLSRYLGVQRVLREPRQRKEDAMSGSFASLGIFDTISRVITHPVSTLSFMGIGALVAATAGIFSWANVAMGALFGFLAPYLFNILWNFFWSYIAKADSRQILLRDYASYTSGNGRFSDEQKNRFLEVERIEAEIEDSGILNRTGTRLLAGYLKLATIFPVIFGTLEFALGRLQLVLWGSVLAQALMPFVLGNLSANSLLALIGLTNLENFAMQWHLPHTLGGLFRIAVIVTGLKLVSLRFIYFRNQIQKILSGNSVWGLDARDIFAKMNSFSDSEKDKLRELLRKRLVNAWGRPELIELLRNKLNVGGKIRAPISYLRYYFTANLIAAAMILTAPFAGLLYAFRFILGEKYPYVSLWLYKGKEFWVSFWHMWIIGAEIGAVIGSGEFLAEHKLLKHIGGKEIGTTAGLLEGEFGAIAWGEQFFGLIDVSRYLPQFIPSAIGAEPVKTPNIKAEKAPAKDSVTPSVIDTKPLKDSALPSVIRAKPVEAKEALARKETVPEETRSDKEKTAPVAENGEVKSISQNVEASNQRITALEKEIRELGRKINSQQDLIAAEQLRQKELKKNETVWVLEEHSYVARGWWLGKARGRAPPQRIIHSYQEWVQRENPEVAVKISGSKNNIKSAEGVVTDLKNQRSEKEKESLEAKIALRKQVLKLAKADKDAAEKAAYDAQRAIEAEIAAANRQLDRARKTLSRDESELKKLQTASAKSIPAEIYYHSYRGLFGRQRCCSGHYVMPEAPIGFSYELRYEPITKAVYAYDRCCRMHEQKVIYYEPRWVLVDDGALSAAKAKIEKSRKTVNDKEQELKTLKARLEELRKLNNELSSVKPEVKKPAAVKPRKERAKNKELQPLTPERKVQPEARKEASREIKRKVTELFPVKENVSKHLPYVLSGIYGSIGSALLGVLTGLGLFYLIARLLRDSNSKPGKEIFDAATLTQSFTLSTDNLKAIVSSFKEDMKLGLSGKDGVSANESSLAMLP
ncbi:MAG: CPBP family glutamic-type intramembrane protease, partial [Candidatus Omnitrophota bacterium]